MASANLYLYHLSQTINNDYDTYNAMVVCAPDAEAAVKIAPNGSPENWADSKYVIVRLLGTALDDAKPGIVLASFNAG